jgi:predicted dehydrogenase
MKKQDLVSRRTVIKGAAVTAAASSISFVKAESVRGTSANSMVEIGWVGNGGQGTRDSELLEQTGKAKIVALADYFQDQLDKAATKFKVDPKRAHLGIDAYKEVIGSKVDAVLLTTPPGFRPEHFKAAAAANKHIYAEKPLAVDVPGCHTVHEAGEKLKAANLTAVVGLQRHYSKAYRAAKKMIDNGDLGVISMAHSAWDQGDLWRREKRTEMKSELDWQIRNWYYFTWLSGDHIVEQNIHNMDVISWMLGSHPIKAYGSGGRLWRKDIGHIYDHFNLVYEYPNQVLLNNTCVQINGTRGDVSETIRGSKGTFTTTAGKGGTGGVRIEGVPGKRGAETPMLYQFQGEPGKPGGGDLHYDQEALAFVNSVLGQGEGEDKYRNDTKYGVESTFMAILGREAAYRKECLGWDELWNTNKKLSFKPEPKAD